MNKAKQKRIMLEELERVIKCLYANDEWNKRRLIELQEEEANETLNQWEKEELEELKARFKAVEEIEKHLEKLI